MNWLDALDEWGGVVVAVRIIASAVIAYCVGYLMGQSNGYREGIHDRRASKDTEYSYWLGPTDPRKGKIHLVK